MRILLTNDDQITAPGLWHAAAALKEVGEVVVCAPDRQLSGAGASISLHAPIRASEIPAPVEGVRAIAVEGTPADSVILALEHLIQEPVDLVVSGINEGSNMGDDVFVSGTVGAALQGYFRGISAIAISVSALKELHYEPAAKLIAALARLFVAGKLPLSTGTGPTPGSPGQGASTRPPLLNINLPNLPMEKLEGVSITRLGRRSYADSIKEGEDGRRKWYWITRNRPIWEEVEGSDVWAVRHGRVSITPLHTDLTAYSLLEHLEGLARNLERVLLP